MRRIIDSKEANEALYAAICRLEEGSSHVVGHEVASQAMIKQETYFQLLDAYTKLLEAYTALLERRGHGDAEED